MELAALCLFTSVDYFIYKGGGWWIMIFFENLESEFHTSFNLLVRRPLLMPVVVVAPLLASD